MDGAVALRRHASSRRSATVLLLVQIGAMLAWFAAAVTPGSLWRIPDGVFDRLFPATFAILFCAGLWTVLRDRGRHSGVIVGTSLCALFVAVTVALALVPTSLPDF